MWKYEADEEKKEIFLYHVEMYNSTAQLDVILWQGSGL